MSNNPKCPVFGCTIPRGIPHEHPAGVSAVMRDPVAPLTTYERAELESLRVDRGSFIRAKIEGFPCSDFGPGLTFNAQYPNGIYVVPACVPIHPGQKLRDALVQAGGLSAESVKEYRRLHHLDPETGEALEVVDMRKSLDALESRGAGIIRRRTLAQSIGKIMAWMMMPPFLGFVLFAIGTYFGWWV